MASYSDRKAALYLIVIDALCITGHFGKYAGEVQNRLTSLKHIYSFVFSENEANKLRKAAYIIENQLSKLSVTSSLPAMLALLTFASAEFAEAKGHKCELWKELSEFAKKSNDWRAVDNKQKVLDFEIATEINDIIINNLV